MKGKESKVNRITLLGRVAMELAVTGRSFLHLGFKCKLIFLVSSRDNES